MQQCLFPVYSNYVSDSISKHWRTCKIYQKIPKRLYSEIFAGTSLSEK